MKMKLLVAALVLVGTSASAEVRGNTRNSPYWCSVNMGLFSLISPLCYIGR